MPNEFLRLFDAVLESSSPDNFLRKVRWVHLNHDRISRRFSTIKITLTIRTCPDPQAVADDEQFYKIQNSSSYDPRSKVQICEKSKTQDRQLYATVSTREVVLLLPASKKDLYEYFKRCEEDRQIDCRNIKGG